MLISGARTRELDRIPEAPECGSGEVLAFDTLYDDYAEFVWRNARRLGTAPSALDDVVQEVFLVAHRKLHELTRTEALRSWMLSIVIRVVRGHRRSLRRKDPNYRSVGALVDPEELPDTSASNPQRAAERMDAVRLLHRILGELSDEKREVFVLAELEEITEAEIARILGDNINTVHSRLRAARKQFEEAVQRHRLRDGWRLG